MIGADFGPSPNTVWVAFLYRWQAVHSLAVSRTVDQLLELGGLAGLAYSSSLFVAIFVNESQLADDSFLMDGNGRLESPRLTLRPFRVRKTFPRAALRKRTV